MKIKIIIATAMTLCQTVTIMQAADVVWYDGAKAVEYSIDKHVEPVVVTAARMFQDDMAAVTGKAAKAVAEKNATVVVTQLDIAGKARKKTLQTAGVDTGRLATMTDGFSIKVSGGKIYVTGSNGRGTAYALLEMSRLAGVSPWIWWGDIVPEHRTRLTLADNYEMMQGASVEYRGIFINDEDWSLRPWSYLNHDKGDYGVISARTYKRIFQLLLRLRANTVWPGMHPGTRAFFKTEGAKAAADSCGIVTGTSHCEPLLRNNVAEWDVKERGAFNYITNKEAVQQYWAERLKEVSGSQGNMFTIGMRGIHDGSMEGVKTMEEKHSALQQVIDDQQKLIDKYIGNADRQMQVFVPYKEVLEIYERGLRVPDNVTLMWCDDNYGYLTRLSNAAEQRRKGGGGVYYHLSYWGRPHDHLWLTTTQPGLIYNEMRQAYDHNVRKLWIANVHDPKVAGYDLELFLDMAWNIDCVSHDTVDKHYHRWLCRQFGNEAGDALIAAMTEYYKLCGERRPEFMGWNQVELDKRLYHRGLSPVGNTELSINEFGNELDRYLDRYDAVCRAVDKAETMIRPELKDAYFAAIKYPVHAAAAHAHKLLEAQKARSLANGSVAKDMNEINRRLYTACARSQNAYQKVRRLTHYYNKVMAGGKWDGIMNMHPRDLPVFGAPVLPLMLTDEECEVWSEECGVENQILHTPHSSPLTETCIPLNACQYSHATEGTRTVSMLGHSMSAVALAKGGSVTYDLDAVDEGKAMLYIAMIPTQAIDGGDLRYAVSIDGDEETVFSLKEPFRSEQWKKNVLRGQALRTMPVNLTKGKHKITIWALDAHIVIDQLMLDFKENRKFYLLPFTSNTSPARSCSSSAP